MYAIAIDIGASYTRVGLFTGESMVRKAMLPTARKKAQFLRQLVAVVKQVLRGIKLNEVVGIGIGSIGLLDMKRGILLHNPNLGISNIPLVAVLSKEFNLPVKLLNDCSAAVLAEQRRGAGKGVENLVYITLSTGIGGGAIVNGNLLLGKDGNGVEIGHTVVDAEGKLKCTCGRAGHWEAYCSGTNLPKFARWWFKHRHIKHSLLFQLAGKGLQGLRAEHIFKAARAADRACLQFLKEVGKLNAIGVANAINCFDPEVVSIGGALALNHPKFVLRPIKREVKRYATNRMPKIGLTPLGEDVVLYGAAYALKL